MNLKTLKLIISLLAILFVTNSCKKSDKLKPGNVDLNGVYQMGNVINILPLKMYTMNGEVTDQSVINDYVKRWHDSSFFTFNKTTIPSDFGKSEIDFSSGNNVTWSWTVLPPYLTTVPSNYTISKKSSDGFVLEAVDSTRVPKVDYGVNRALMLFDNSNTVKMVGNCGPFSCTSRIAFPFIIKDGQLYLQLYACSINCSQNEDLVVPGLVQPGFNPTSASSYSETQIVGSFDMALIHQLIPGDTVLFQNRTIQFKKK